MPLLAIGNLTPKGVQILKTIAMREGKIFKGRPSVRALLEATADGKYELISTEELNKLREKAK